MAHCFLSSFNANFFRVSLDIFYFLVSQKRMSPYDVLQVSSRATEEEIRLAYKSMVRELVFFPE